MERLLKVKETAERLGITTQSLRNHVKGYYFRNGKPVQFKDKFDLHPVMVGGSRLFKESEVNRYIEKMTVI